MAQCLRGGGFDVSRGIRRGPCPGQRLWRGQRWWGPWWGSSEWLCGCEGWQGMSGRGRVEPGTGSLAAVRRPLSRPAAGVLANDHPRAPDRIRGRAMSVDLQALTHYDVIIIGAGAAGLMCAITAGPDEAAACCCSTTPPEPGAKILISGGGRCNFTNTATAPERFLSDNSAFRPLRAGPLHPRSIHRSGATPRHRLPRESQRPVVLRRFRARHRRHAAGRGPRLLAVDLRLAHTDHRPEQSRLIPCRHRSRRIHRAQPGSGHRRIIDPQTWRHRLRVRRRAPASACV